MVRAKTFYKKSRNICLKCGKKITSEISKRLFCLSCGIRHSELIFGLERLNLRQF